MLYGTTLRLPGEFFIPDSISADPRAFVGKLKTLFQDIPAVPASMHAKYRVFQHDSLNSCTHVFLRSATSVLEPSRGREEDQRQGLRHESQRTREDRLHKRPQASLPGRSGRAAQADPATSKLARGGPLHGRGRPTAFSAARRADNRHSAQQQTSPAEPSQEKSFVSFMPHEGH